MATRTVRLDAEAERTLREIRSATGLPISEALKEGLRVLRGQIETSHKRTAYEMWRAYDLGPGGYAIAPARESRRGVRLALERKRRR
jgi:hypothetical protein